MRLNVYADIMVGFTDLRFFLLVILFELNMLYRRTVSIIFLPTFLDGCWPSCATGSFCVKCNILRRNLQSYKCGCFDFDNVKRCQILASQSATLLSLNTYHSILNLNLLSSFGLPQFSRSLTGRQAFNVIIPIYLVKTKWQKIRIENVRRFNQVCYKIAGACELYFSNVEINNRSEGNKVRKTK